MPSGSGCDGDKRYQCWYQAWDSFEEWCRDYDEYCPSWDDGGGLTRVESGGGGGWP